MRTYRNQFPTAFHDIPSVLLSGDFADESWGNDVCPSFRCRRSGAKIWVNHPEYDSRECGGLRYAVTFQDGDGKSGDNDFGIEYDRISDVLTFLSGARAMRLALLQTPPHGSPKLEAR